MTVDELTSSAAGVQYYHFVRDTIISFVTVVSTYFFSYILLDSYRRRHKTKNEDEDEEDLEHERGFLPFLLSTFVLTVAILWLLLISLTVLISTPNVSLHWLFYWLTNDILIVSWSRLLVITSISLFIIAPFAFLYYEAEGLGESKRFSSRFLETMIVLAFFSVVIFGSFRVFFAVLTGQSALHSIVATLFSWLSYWLTAPLSILSSHLTSLLSSLLFSIVSVLRAVFLFSDSDSSSSSSSLSSPPFASSLHSNDDFRHKTIWSSDSIGYNIPGMFFFLVFCNEGLRILIQRFFSLRVPLNYRQQLTEKIDICGFQISVLKRQLEDSGNLRRNDSSIRIDKPTIQKRIHLLMQQQRMAKEQLVGASGFLRSPLVRNFVSCLLVLMSLFLTWHILLRVAQRELKLILGISSNYNRTRLGETVTEGVHMNSVTGNVNNGVPSLNRTPSFSSYGTFASLLSFLFGLVLGPTPLTQPVITRPLLVFIGDMIIVLYFVSVTLVGLYSSSFFSSFAPQIGWLFKLSNDRRNNARSSTLLKSPISQRSMLSSFFIAMIPFRSVLLKSTWKSKSKSSNYATAVSSSSSFSPSSHRVSSTSAQLLVVNSAILLSLTSSLPVVVWMLGLVEFDLVNYYPPSLALLEGWLWNRWQMHCYNIVFLAISAYQVVPIGQSLFRYYTSRHNNIDELSSMDPSISSSVLFCDDDGINNLYGTLEDDNMKNKLCTSTDFSQKNVDNAETTDNTDRDTERETETVTDTDANHDIITTSTKNDEDRTETSIPNNSRLKRTPSLSMSSLPSLSSFTSVLSTPLSMLYPRRSSSSHSLSSSRPPSLSSSRSLSSHSLSSSPSA